MTQQPHHSPKSILITGASSGLGAALAEAYAGPGVTLFLSGRNEERLAAFADLCGAKGAEVACQTLDVTDQTAVKAWIDASDARRPLDLVVANAGISSGTGGGVGRGAGGETDELSRLIFATNVDGVLNTIHPAIAHMRGRGQGQIAIMSSIAGFRGLASAPSYCASKAAVKSLGEGLRGVLAPDGIRVSVICPGYVRTAMTEANKFPMPFLMPVERATRIMVRGLARNEARIAFPWQMLFLVWLLQTLPVSWTDPIVGRLPRK